MQQKILDDKPRWHEFRKGSRIKIRPLTRKKSRECVKACKGDQDKYEELVADHCIVDQDGFVGEDNKKLTMTKANKLLMWNNTETGPFIEKHAGGLQEIDEAEIKNLKKSPAGSTPAT